MKNIKLYLVVLASILFFASCGGEEEQIPAKVKPERLSISGPLGEYLEIVNNEYEIIDDWGGKLSIKVKSIGTIPDEFLKDKEFNLTVSILGENGMPVSGIEDFDLSGSDDKVISLLEGNSTEEVISFSTLLGGYHAREHNEKAKKFSVSSTLKDKEESVVIYSNSDNEETFNNEQSDDFSSDIQENENIASSTSNEDWDAILKSYEEYIDQYIKLIKKAKDGDISAMTEYVEMMEKATDLAEKLKNAGDDLSPSQIAKFTKLQMKLANAASEL